MKRSLSTISLLAICIVSLGVIFAAVHVGMGSLYQIGLDNSVKQYDQQYTGLVELSEEQKVEQTKSLANINFLVEKMLHWNSYSPEALSLAAYTRWLNSYSEENSDSYEEFLSEAVVLNSKAIVSRPIYPDIYAQQVYAKNALVSPKEDVFAPLYLAERFGPYEKATARAGIDFYFGFWEQISTQDKVKASRYILTPQKYGLSIRQRDEIFRNAPYKQRVCNLLAFSNKKSRVCSN
ncbi:hypothetical protein P7F88_20100 [Vibrio hannami]|uniref:hypothetical protein n=1 Tax=Vibrio hannami TaxID=2717094 RepID=UPI00240EDF79|nr:hypothetical protein [Vibrio hannami]MDG3088248.1 hypothetical protein [Vibrio hannami]